MNGTEIRAKLVHLRTIFQGFQPLAQTYFSAIQLKMVKARQQNAIYSRLNQSAGTDTKISTSFRCSHD
jgi:hypothetical protein